MEITEQQKESLGKPVNVKFSLAQVIYLVQMLHKSCVELAEGKCDCPGCNARMHENKMIAGIMCKMAEEQIGEKEVLDMIKLVDRINTKMPQEVDVEDLMKRMFTKTKPHGQA